MTDRELLELAAKAAGIRIDKSEANGGGVGNDGFSVTGDAMLDWHNNIRWNPLTDDGDALRLAVDLGVDVQQFQATALVEAWKYPNQACGQDYGQDKYAATRRAIVCAAAEICKAMG